MASQTACSKTERMTALEFDTHKIVKALREARTDESPVVVTVGQAVGKYGN